MSPGESASDAVPDCTVTWPSKTVNCSIVPGPCGWLSKLRSRIKANVIDLVTAGIFGGRQDHDPTALGAILDHRHLTGPQDINPVAGFTIF